jgi:hypothetical protein
MRTRYALGNRQFSQSNKALWSKQTRQSLKIFTNEQPYLLENRRKARAIRHARDPRKPAFLDFGRQAFPHFPFPEFAILVLFPLLQGCSHFRYAPKKIPEPVRLGR